MKQQYDEKMPRAVPMSPAKTLDPDTVRTSGNERKAEAYRAACQKAAALNAARAKCRDMIDAALKSSIGNAALLSRAMIEAGAAASRDLGDAPSTAFLLGHLGRRIREGDHIDF